MRGGMHGALAALLTLAVVAALAHAQNPACKVYDPVYGEQYDLNVLAKASGNYDITTVTDGKARYKYLLNVCQKLNDNTVSISTGDVKSCSTTWEVDMVNKDQKPKNLGSLGDAVVKSRGQIVIKYSDGDVCTRTNKPRQASVILTCDKNAGLGKPVFVQEDNQCDYSFAWRTSAACGVKVTVPSSAPPKNCEVVDNNAKMRYDLTALSKSSGNWIVYDSEYQYAINICRDLNGMASCGTGSGACQLKPSDASFAKNLGLSSARPSIDSDGLLTIEMTGGKSCHGGTDTRSATIVFECAQGKGLGAPVFVQETDDCEYIFSWATSAACGSPMSSTRPCSVIDRITMKVYDLSGLALPSTASANYVIKSQVAEDVKYQYKINVCNSLVSADNDCRAGVAICQTDPTGAQTPRSLGSVAKLNVVDNNVVATYTDGDLCEDTGGRITTVIYYTCDVTAGSGSPRLITAIDDCEYVISWRTAHACAVDAIAPTSANNGSNGGTGGGGGGANVGLIIFLVILSLIVVYFVGGAIYNRSKGKKGLEQIPHYDFFQAIYYTIIGSCSRRSSYDDGGGAIQL